MGIEFVCDCGTQMTAADYHGGLLARCPDCAGILRVPRNIKPDVPETSPEPETSAETSPESAETASLEAKRETRPESTESAPNEPAPVAGARVPKPAELVDALICAMCGEGVDAHGGIYCTRCHAGYHATCWEESGGCAVPVCKAGPGSRKKVKHAEAVEGKLRPCPVCAEMIPEHAHRCRYCGEFTSREMRKASRPRASHPTKTSKQAGLGLIASLIGLFPSGSLSLSAIYFLVMSALPFIGIGLGIWALKDIRAYRGEKSGTWTAGFAIGIGVIGIIKGVINLID